MNNNHFPKMHEDDEGKTQKYVIVGKPDAKRKNRLEKKRTGTKGEKELPLFYTLPIFKGNKHDFL